MDKEFVRLIAEGLVKARNKARKKEIETYGHDSSPKAAPVGQRALKAMSKTKHDKSGAAKRAIFRGNRALESLLVEGLVKAMNKAKKNSMQGDTPEARKKFRDKASKSPTGTKAGDEHIALDAAGMSRRGGRKATSKIWLKASKRMRKGQDFTALESLIVDGFEKLLEDRDSVIAAGGDADAYDSISKTKGIKPSRARPKGLPIAPTGKPSNDVSSIRKELRAQGIKVANQKRPRNDALGKMGGMYDKKGNPVQNKGGSNKDAFRKGKASKPLPLNLKGKPGAGKKMGDVRGKAVNTSRSTGKEDGKINAIQSGFDKLVSGLAKGKK